MKKTYIIPNQKVAELEISSLLCESIRPYNELGDGVQLSKRHIWDSEDDEEW